MKRTLSLTALVFGVTLASACRRDRTPPPAPAPAPPPEVAAPEPEDAQLTSDLAAELARAFQRESLSARAEGARVVVLDRTFVAHARVLQVVNEEVTTAAIDVSFDVDGHPQEAFHVTAIAHDRNRPEALQHAIREWSVANAIAMARAMRPREAGTDAGAQTLRLGSYDVFAGPMGARGEVPTDWDSRTNAITAALVARLEPDIQQLVPSSPSPFHGVRFTVHVQNGVGTAGDCRVDNVANERLCELVRSYTWPRAEGETDGYIVKQYYLLTSPGR